MSFSFLLNNISISEKKKHKTKFLVVSTDAVKMCDHLNENVSCFRLRNDIIFSETPCITN